MGAMKFLREDSEGRLQQAPAPAMGWEMWSTRILLAALVLGGILYVLGRGSAERLLGGTTVPLGLLMGLAALVLIVNLHLVTQRKLLREVTVALTASTAYVERLAQYSFVDPDTELFNRRFFDHLFSQQSKAMNRSGRPTTLLLVETAAQKQEQQEARLAIATASILRGNFRGSDYVLHNSGRQFLVLLPDTTGTQARFALERLENKVDAWNLENPDVEMVLTHELCTCRPGDHFWESLGAIEDRLRSRCTASNAGSAPAVFVLDN